MTDFRVGTHVRFAEGEATKMRLAFVAARARWDSNHAETFLLVSPCGL